MSRDNIFKKFTNSIYKPNEAYRKYIKEGIGKSIIYALLLCLILGGIKGGIQAFKFNYELKNTISKLEDDRYKFEIKDGELNIESSPVKIDENNILIYVDKDKSIEDEDSLKSLTIHEDTYVLILRDGMIVDSNMSENPYATKMKYTYKEMQIADNINNENVIKGIENMKVPIISFFIIIFMTQEFINYLVTAFLIAVIFLLLSRVLGFTLKLAEVFSLVIYVQTLSVLLVTALTIVIPGVLFDMAGMVGTSLYMFLTLKNIKKEGIN